MKTSCAIGTTRTHGWIDWTENFVVPLKKKKYRAPRTPLPLTHKSRSRNSMSPHNFYCGFTVMSHSDRHTTAQPRKSEEKTFLLNVAFTTTFHWNCLLMLIEGFWIAVDFFQLFQARRSWKNAEKESDLVVLCMWMFWHSCLIRGRVCVFLCLNSSSTSLQIWSFNKSSDLV